MQIEAGSPHPRSACNGPIGHQQHSVDTIRTDPPSTSTASP